VGDIADDLTNDMLDARAVHDAGQCEGDCEWCREPEQDRHSKRAVLKQLRKRMRTVSRG